MSRSTLAACTLAAALAWGSHAHAQSLAVTKTLDNPVSALLSGAWELDEELTARLHPKAVEDINLLRVEFRVDDSILELIPRKFDPLFAGRTIYAAGTIRSWSGDLSLFVLTTSGGIPQLVWFGEAGDDPVGRTGAWRVQLVAGEDTALDILFISRAEQAPFAAYRRGSRAPAAAPDARP